jgi:hypothetical protein
MNLTQMQERLRMELLRRIQRGSVSVSLLARQTGFAQAHISNFLRGYRHLSLDAMDRILQAQHMIASDLLIPTRVTASGGPGIERDSIPIVSHAAALFEPVIRPSAVQSMLFVSPDALEDIRSRPVPGRRAWQRFVAVRIPSADALAMDPIVLPDAVALIDRHYNSLRPYRPNRANLYAVRHGAHLRLRYLDFLLNRLVLRPSNMAFPIDLIDFAPGETPNELITGRLALLLNEL